MRLRRYLLRIFDWFLGECSDASRAREATLRKGSDAPPFVHIRRPQSGQLFLIYAGLDANMLSENAYKQLLLLDFLRTTGLVNRNITWIRDPYLDDYRQGFGPEIPDRDSLYEWHRQHLASLPHVREVYTIGYSSGAYGALLFGHRLQVKQVWAFSPRTSCPTHEQDAVSRRELRDHLQDDNGVTRYDIWYDRLNRFDKSFSENLRECPGVTVHAHHGFGGTHLLLAHMVETGEFQTLLPPDVAPVSPTAMHASDETG